MDLESVEMTLIHEINVDQEQESWNNLDKILKYILIGDASMSVVVNAQY